MSEQESIKNSIDNLRNEMINENKNMNNVFTAIFGMLNTIRADQKVIIQEKIESNNLAESVVYDQEFMNNYYAPNGQADHLFNTIILQQQFFHLRNYQ